MATTALKPTTSKKRRRLPIRRRFSNLLSRAFRVGGRLRSEDSSELLDADWLDPDWLDPDLPDPDREIFLKGIVLSSGVSSLVA